MKWLQILKMVGPVAVAAFVPGGALLAPIIVGAIESAEGLRDATGSEKKAHALELVVAGATAVNVVAQKPVLNPENAKQTASDAIDAVVGTVNLLSQVHAIEGTGPAPIA